MSGPNAENLRTFLGACDEFVARSSVRTVMDLGSRDGEVALGLKEHFPNATVYAFECNPAAIELCRRNINRPEVVLVERAVSDFNGPTDFYAIDPQRTITPHADGNIGASSLFRANADYPHEKYVQNKITVEAVRVEDWARAAGVASVDIVWMDVQGAALHALKGFGQMLRRVKVMQLEVEYKPMYLGQPLASEVQAYLEGNGLVRRRKLNDSEWFGDEIYCGRDLLPWRERWRRWARGL